jgi:hypothetical protein
MKKIQMIEKILNNWRGFPNTSVAGHYEFLSQTVCANSLEIRHILDLINNPADIQIKRKVFSIFIHEITHWLDHTSTLWGQNFLIDIFNAFNAKENEDIEELWRIQKLFSDLSRINFADYYTVNGSAATKPWNKQPWQYESGSGLQFGSDGRIRENYPFLYIKVFTNEGEFVKRVPLSIVSLLETNAVAAEFKLETALLSVLSQEELIIESRLIEKQSIEKLYIPELTVYSVAAHCLANLTGITDAMEAYFLASALSTLCLNLPSQVFHLLKIPADVQELLGNRAKHMVSLPDRGFAFYLLAMHGSKDNPSDILGWLESAVYSAGLPPLKEIEKLVVQEMDELHKRIIRDPLMEKLIESGLTREAMEENYISQYTTLKKLLSISKENFQKRGIYGDHELCLKSLVTKDDNCLKLPPILLGDDEIVQLGNEAIEQHYQGLEEWIEYVWGIEDKLREFNKACFV